VKFRRRGSAETSRDGRRGALSVQLDQLADRTIEVLAALLVGDPVDLPTDPAGSAITSLVGLRLETPPCQVT
jgi:hypothetical protein